MGPCAHVEPQPLEVFMLSIGKATGFHGRIICFVGRSMDADDDCTALAWSSWKGCTSMIGHGVDFCQ